MRVDVHAHYWPAEYLDLLVDLGRDDLVRIGRQAPDFDGRLAEMDSARVDAQVLSAIGINVEVAHPEGALKAARLINDIYADAIDYSKGRFRAFGSVALPHVEESIAETDRCLEELNFSGIALPCSAGGKPIDHPDFEPFWANLARHDAVVYVHPTGSNSAMHPGLENWMLHTAYGSPLQIAVAAIRLMYSGVSTRYPNLKFVFALCGGMLPFLWPRQERNLRRGIERSATAAVGTGMFAYLNEIAIDRTDPMSGLREFWYDTSTQDLPLALLAAKQTYGADRLLLGSDAIFASVPEVVDYISSSEYLTDEEKTNILDHNAQNLLHLPEVSYRR
jgi:predicted TIM-barrel fold metal-dependent hydrolase